MGRGSTAKAWAMILMTVMVLTAFGGLSGLAEAPIAEKIPTSQIVYWMEDFEGYTPGQPIPLPSYDCTAAVPPPGSPSGSIYPSLTTGSVCAHLGPGGYYSSMGINGNQTTHAYLGGWFYIPTDGRLDLIITDEITYETVIMISMFPGGTVYFWFDGSTIVPISGINWTPGTWHELWVEYDEIVQQYGIWWDGFQASNIGPFMIPATNIDGFIWMAGMSNEAYIDNCYHWDIDNAPVADAGFDQMHLQNTLVTFDGSGSYDDNGITNYWWNFTDGIPITLTGVNPSYTFFNAGVFTVTLTVMDTTGQTDSDDMTVTVVDIFDKDILPAAGSNDWILMSFPNKISGHPFTVIVDARDDGGGLVQWDMIRGWDAKNQTWMTSATFWPPSLNTFNYVDNTMGFWLHITNYGDGILTFVGPMAAPGEMAIIHLYAGWNLIGYPFPNPQEMFNTIGSLLSVQSVETYDPMNPYHLRVVNVGSEWHEPGHAYWVYVAFDEDLWMWCP